jgi:hypothetical protein
MTMVTNSPSPVVPALEDTNFLRDIKPPLALPSWWPWVLGVVAAMVAAGVIYLIWRAWKQSRAYAGLPPIIPAHMRAKYKLDEALRLIGQPQPFCIAVSDTVRVYLEERFNFHAPERTTEEFLRELQATSLLLPDQKSSLGEFLQSCDLVKFARYEPGEAELRDLHASAVRLVEETEPAAEATGQELPPKL